MRKLIIMLLMVLFTTSAKVSAQSPQQCREILTEYFDARSKEIPYGIDDIIVVEKIKYENSIVSVGLLVSDHHRSVRTVADELFRKFKAEFAPHEATEEIKQLLNTMITAGTHIEFVFLGRMTDSVVKHVVSLQRLKEIHGMMP